MRKREPELFERIHKMLPENDRCRLRLTGEFVSDISDASSKLWLDIGYQS